MRSLKRHGNPLMGDDAVAMRAERRWPMAAAVLGAVILQVGTPHRGRVPGWWVFPILELVLLVFLVVVDLGRIDSRARFTRRLTIGLIAVMSAANAPGIDLTTTSSTVRPASTRPTCWAEAAVWVTNAIVFSLWYWELTEAGPPSGRSAGRAPSFAFPENATPELVPEGWAPTYLDYLYLAYTNATAFSPTDTLPVRMWAKMTMMLQSSASLVAIS